MKRKFDESTNTPSREKEGFSKDREDKKNHATPFVRSFEHVDGQWPSFVYIKINPKKISKILILALSHLCDKNNIECNKLFIENNPHISLSKPFTLRHHQIELFLQQLSIEIDIVAKM